MPTVVACYGRPPVSRIPVRQHRLVASVRFDSGRDSPYPAGGNIWVRPTEDELALVMLEAVLTERR